jgi:HTH-type transcriptional regulator / antitoxin HigA
MQSIKYKIIKSKDQYIQYCKALESLLEMKTINNDVKDEVELLTFLIEKWDAENSTFKDSDPIEILDYLMKDRNMKAKDLVEILGVSKGLVSDILNYKKGLSKKIIRLLSSEFKLSQEIFNRPYKLKNPANSHLRGASVMNTTKKIKLAY